MAASRDDISGWFDSGKRMRAGWMLVVTDTYDWKDYPVYAYSVDECQKKYDDIFKADNMQRVQEVYDLHLDKAMQMKEYRAMHLPV